MARRICVTVPRARRQVAGIRAWWLENREKAPGAFDEDFDNAVDLLYSHPEVGVVVGGTRGLQTRRIYLQRGRYYIYYQVTANAIFIVAVIHSSRRPPRGL